VVALYFPVEGTLRAGGGIMSIDHGEGFAVRSPFLGKDGKVVKGFVRGGQFIDAVASGLTVSAPDTRNIVKENPEAVRVTLERFVRRCLNRTPKRGTQSCRSDTA
jgi:hypothetical protein